MLHQLAYEVPIITLVLLPLVNSEKIYIAHRYQSHPDFASVKISPNSSKHQNKNIILLVIPLDI